MRGRQKRPISDDFGPRISIDSPADQPLKKSEKSDSSPIMVSSRDSHKRHPLFPDIRPARKEGRVVTIVDRIVHRSEVIAIDAESYRLKESKEAVRSRAKKRARRSRTSNNTPS